MRKIRLYVALSVFVKWVGLAANLVLMTVLTIFLEELYLGHAHKHEFVQTIFIAAGVLVVRLICHFTEVTMSFKAVCTMKKKFRGAVYQKLLSLGNAYKEQVPTGGILQDVVEGVDQLEVYYGTLLPDFFFGILATITLFGYLCYIHFVTAICLLLAIALMPFVIALVQTFTKRCSEAYWKQYTRVSHLFLENLQGLTTLKIYGADKERHTSMNAESEQLKVHGLRMSLFRIDTITLMDLIAGLGMASAAILSVYAFTQGELAIEGCLHILVLSDEFFLPMRELGTHFHHAMKGRAAAKKMKALLDLPEHRCGDKPFPKSGKLCCNHVTFSYDGHRDILHQVNIEFQETGVTAIVGESGCGKSTLADILMGCHPGYLDRVLVNQIPISDIDAHSCMQQMTYVGHQPYFFHGSVADNLRLAKPDATESEMWQVLDLVQIGDALRRRQGLETVMAEDDLHLSGGQLQRINLARAILHDSRIYIFDEATSNMDGQSEHYAMEAIYTLGKCKMVILITHHLPNVIKADQIYVMQKGNITESGSHEELLNRKGAYARLWTTQHRITCKRDGGVFDEA